MPQFDVLGVIVSESPGEVDRLYRELMAAGAPGHREPWDAFWGQR